MLVGCDLARTSGASAVERYVTAAPERTLWAAMTSVRWEGDLTGRHSLAVVNRAIVLGLLRQGIKVETCAQQDGPYRVPDRVKVRETSGDVDVTVRHQWPPRLAGGHRGRLVFWQPWEYGSVPRDWARFAAHVADEVWCYTNFVRDCYVESAVDPSKCHIVPLGVDLSLYHHAGRQFQLPDAKCTFLFVGGTIQRKGIDVLLSGFVEAFENRDDVLLVIKGFGGGSFYRGSSITDLVDAIGRARPVTPRVEYIDADVSDVELASLYRAADVLVHPYRGEGYALPVAEALACGTPVIVTAGGATEDFVADGAGWKIPAKKTILRPEVLGLPEPGGHAHWLEPDHSAFVSTLRHVADNAEARSDAARVARMGRNQLSWQNGISAAVDRIRSLAV